MQSLRTLPLLVSLLLSMLTSACLMGGPKPPPPPFRIEMYGPGLEVTRNGALVTLSDDEGESIGRLRVASHSLRAQQSNAVPIGRIRIATDGWVFSDRSGADICELSNSRELPFRVDCVDDLSWTATPQQTGVTVQTPTGEETFVPLRVEAVPIKSAGKPWSAHAYAVVHHAFEPQFEGKTDVAAYTLLAWALRTTEIHTPDHEAPLEPFGPAPLVDMPPDEAPLDGAPPDTASADEDGQPVLPSGAQD